MEIKLPKPFMVTLPIGNNPEEATEQDFTLIQIPF